MDPFISTDDLATFTGQVLDEDRAEFAVAAACQSVRTYLNRPLNLTTETRLLSGAGTNALVLAWPVVEILTVTLYPNDEDFEEELLPEDYVVDGAVLYRREGWWPKGLLNIAVEYTHGYAVDDSEVDDSGDIQVGRVPEDIQAVALELADQLYSAGTSVGGSGETSGYTIGPDSYSETFDVGAAARDVSGGGLNAGQKARLQPYRAVPV